MECLSVERRTRGDTSFRGQEKAACQARTVHATDGCIFWGMSLLLRLIFFLQDLLSLFVHKLSR